MSADTILLWGGVAGALTAIIALIVTVVKTIRKAFRFFINLKDSVDTLVKHDHAQYLSILRLTVMSENIPLSERIIAGKEYIENDGNGDVKHYYETVLKPHDTLKGE